MLKSVNKDTKLVVNQKLQINLDTDKSVKISKGGRAVKFDFHTLSILEKFCTPNTISNVIFGYSNFSPFDSMKRKIFPK